jgi:hypothetical protein
LPPTWFVTVWKKKCIFEIFNISEK